MRQLPVAVALATLLPGLAQACASCGCSLSSDWESQGLVAEPGWRLDLRYDYIKQNQLRSGSGTASPGDKAVPQDREIEQVTTNRYYTVALDYSPDRDWGVNLQLPFVDRFHQTITPDPVPGSSNTNVSESRAQKLGDIRISGRYTGFNETHNIGVIVGFKLPSGDYKQRFSSGNEAGNPLDRGLQAGSGSTDLMLGAFHANALSRDWDYFFKGQWQHALATKDAYRPGDSLSLSGGTRYLGYEWITPELQLNYQYKSKDSGTNADIDNSGGTLVYLSPGATIKLSQQTKLYGFVQLPLQQQVNGLQLAPRWTATAGMRYAF